MRKKPYGRSCLNEKLRRSLFVGMHIISRIALRGLKWSCIMWTEKQKNTLSWIISTEFLSIPTRITGPCAVPCLWEDHNQRKRGLVQDGETLQEIA